MRGFTMRAMGYSSASILMFVMALVLSSELFLVGGIITAVLMLLSLSMLPRAPRIKRTTDRSAIFEGEKVEATVKVDGRGKAGNVEVFDRLSPGLSLENGLNLYRMPSGQDEFSYSFNAPLRGYHPVGPTMVRRWDPLWLWFKETNEDNGEQLVVFPAMSTSRTGVLSLKEQRARPGEMRLRKVGAGKEFHSIRDYTTTDPFNTINWKASARNRKLLVNQFETESVTDIMFIIDARMVTRVGTMVENPLERSIRFCASLSSLLLNRSNRVGLVIYGPSVTVIKPKGGPSHMTGVLHTLTNIVPSGFNTLGATTTYALSYIPPNCPIFLLSPLSEDPTVKDAMRQLVGRGHKVTIVSPSGIDFEKAVYNGNITPRYLLKKLVRDDMLVDLAAMGIKVIDWGPEKDVAWALREVWA